MVSGMIGKSVGKTAGEAADKDIRAIQEELLGLYGSLENIDKVGKQVGIDLAGAWGSKNVAGLQHFKSTVIAFTKELERNKQIQADIAAIKPGALMSPALMAQLGGGGLTDETRAGLGQFLAGQAQQGIGGLGTFMSATGLGAYTQAQAAYDQMLKDLAGKRPDEYGVGEADALAKAKAELNKARAGMGPLTAGGAAGLGGAAAALFAQLQEQGASPVEALQQMGPVLTDLQRYFEAMGQSGGAAFQQIAGLAQFASDEGVAKAVTSVSGLNDVMVSLQNSGLMNQEIFGGLTEQITATYQGLVEQGKGGEQALGLMQKPLQSIWQMQQDFGYEVDEATQALIDQAKESGKIGDQFRPATDKMVTAIDKLIRRFGEFLDKFKLIPTDVDVDVNYHHNNYEPPDGSDGDGGGAGGGSPQESFGIGRLSTIRLPRVNVAAMRPAAAAAPVTVVVQAWDGESVDAWLRRGGARKLTAGVVPYLPGQLTEMGLVRR